MRLCARIKKISIQQEYSNVKRFFSNHSSKLARVFLYLGFSLFWNLVSSLREGFRNFEN